MIIQERLLKIIRDDNYAAGFQSLGQYRTALLQTARGEVEDAPEDGLLPCPFCGGTDAFVERLDNCSAYVMCSSMLDEHSCCTARGPNGIQEDDEEEIPGAAAAIAAWNQRAATAVQGEAVAVLYADGTVLTKAECGDSFAVCCKVQTPLYAAPQPVEQQPSMDDLAAALLEQVRKRDALLGDLYVEYLRGGTPNWEPLFEQAHQLISCAMPEPAQSYALYFAEQQPAEQQPAPHPDDAAVDRFAVAMKDKLAASREKGRHGWQNATAPHLSALLYDHLYKADPLDVGNLAMMLHQNGQVIEQQPAPDVAVVLERIDRELRPRSMCRDCADGNGRCDSGELCDPHQRADELMGLLRASLAAPDVSGLVEAVTPKIIDWVRCGLSVNGWLKDGTHPALEKLIAAYHEAHRKGGEQ